MAAGWHYETRYTYRGSTFRVLVKDTAMPRMNDEILECVMYLYPSIDDAREGVRAGGSGFFAAMQAGPQFTPRSQVVYAVTNSHVIREGKSPVVRVNTAAGEIEVLQFEQGDWVDHPNGDDVSVCMLPLPFGSQFKAKTILTDGFITREKMERYNIGPGDEVVMPGRFVSHEGKQRNLPSVRFGSIAQNPWEPIRNLRGLLQESFLAEIRSLPGYSGSPVFIYEPPFYNKFVRTEKVPFSLLGIDWGHLPNWEPVYETDDSTGERMPIPGQFVKANTGMAGVVPAWKILELLECEDVVETRKQYLKERTEAQYRDVASFDVATDDISDTSKPFTEGDFDSALHKVTRKVKPDRG